MYYSKSFSQDGKNLSIPQNYSGNTFRVKDETSRIHSSGEEFSSENFTEKEALEEVAENEKSEPKIAAKSGNILDGLLQNISFEDVLLLGLIFVIHKDNPNDTLLLLLLILLVAK